MRKHMTYDVLYEEYLKSTDNPYGYTQFKAIIQEYERNHDYKYHNVYEPGREMQFDFAGDNLWIVDKDTGEAVKAIVLVCVLPYSMLSYVTALPSAKIEYLFQALSRAVRYFGGVAEVSKTDNMRQWIRKTQRDRAGRMPPCQATGQRSGREPCQPDIQILLQPHLPRHLLFL